jgi:hypothetical protein
VKLKPKQLDLTKDLVMLGGKITLSNGTSSDLSLNFASNNNSGLYVDSSNILSFVVNGTNCLSLEPDTTIIISGNKSLVLPVGSTSQRPDAAFRGMVRYNSTLDAYEGYNGSSWDYFLSASATSAKPFTVNTIDSSVTSDYTVVLSDYYIFVDASSCNVNITLPSGSTPGSPYIIKKIDSSSNKVTIIPSDSSTIDSYSFYATSTQNDSFTVTYDGSNWFIVNTFSSNIA